MVKNNTLQQVKDKVVLIAALDWGMGHTTRCVSVIRTLLLNGNNVIFAGNEKQNQFIKRDFPEIETLYLEGYQITLDSSRNTYFQLVKQLPNVNKAIKRERKWLNDYLKNNPVDMVVSDNRYGLYHDAVESILLTHQLNLQVPSFKLLVNLRLRKLVEKFDAVWVPDTPELKLTGMLAQQKLNIPTYFIGPLNRFDRHEGEEKKYNHLIIMSGPEPERSNFLIYARAELEVLNGNFAIVGEQVEGVDSYLNPTTKELGLLIAQSDCVYSRAGYTTIMEMIGLNQKALLIPTRGQYEQEYLAKHIKHPMLTFVFVM